MSPTLRLFRQMSPPKLLALKTNLVGWSVVTKMFLANRLRGLGSRPVDKKCVLAIIVAAVNKLRRC